MHANVPLWFQCTQHELVCTPALLKCPLHVNAHVRVCVPGRRKLEEAALGEKEWFMRGEIDAGACGMHPSVHLQPGCIFRHWDKVFFVFFNVRMFWFLTAQSMLGFVLLCINLHLCIRSKCRPPPQELCAGG